MTLGGIIRKWMERREIFRRSHAWVEGARICDEMLADLGAVASDDQAQLLSLTQAAAMSGYSREHLGRLVRDAKIPNAGTPNAPRIRRCDLPTKPGYLPTRDPALHLLVSSKGQIVRSVANPERGT